MSNSYGIPTYTLWGYRLQNTILRRVQHGIPTYTPWGYRLQNYEDRQESVMEFPPTLCGATAYKNAVK